MFQQKYWDKEEDNIDITLEWNRKLEIISNQTNHFNIHPSNSNYAGYRNRLMAINTKNFFGKFCVLSILFWYSEYLSTFPKFKNWRIWKTKWAIIFRASAQSGCFKNRLFNYGSHAAEHMTLRRLNSFESYVCSKFPERWLFGVLVYV